MGWVLCHSSVRISPSCSSNPALTMAPWKDLGGEGNYEREIYGFCKVFSANFSEQKFDIKTVEATCLLTLIRSSSI